MAAGRLHCWKIVESRKVFASCESHGICLATLIKRNVGKRNVLMYFGRFVVLGPYDIDIL